MASDISPSRRRSASRTTASFWLTESVQVLYTTSPPIPIARSARLAKGREREWEGCQRGEPAKQAIGDRKECGSGVGPKLASSAEGKGQVVSGEEEK